MIIEGLMDEIIIVGPYNTMDRNDEYTYSFDPSEGFGGKGDLYLDWIESTLIPLVQDNFRVDIQRDTLGIMGSSLGGLISCYAGWTRSEVYGKIGCMSSSFWWND
jgi:predicted alpha/beta superfamily hydrolase